MPEERNNPYEFSRENELEQLNQKLAESNRKLDELKERTWNRRYNQLKLRSSFLIGFAAGMGGVGIITKAALRKAKAKHDEERRTRTYGDGD